MTGPVANDHELSVDRAAQFALRQFGYAPSDVESMDRLPQGIKNLNYRVRAGGQEWVLKCHQAAGAAGRLAFSHRLELTLANAGFPVAELQRLESGDTFAKTEAGIFTLHAWVRGQQISIDARDLAHDQHPGLAGELGSMLGLLHRCGADALGEPVAMVDVAALLAGPSRTVASIRHGRPHRFRKTLRLRTSKAEFDRWILRNLAGLYRDAANLSSPRAASLIDPADGVLAHNDLNWENLIFDQELDVAAVLDFDNACLMPRALDVGAAAVVLVGADVARLDRFLAGYSAEAGEQVSRAAVLVGMRWKCARSLLWSIDSYLSGRVADTELVATWCRHLHDCLRALPPIRSADSAPR